MTRRSIPAPVVWIGLGLLLTIWFVGRYRGTWLGDPVLDQYLDRHDGDVVAAFKDVESPHLNAKGDIVSLGLLRTINRHRLPSLRYSNVALQYVKQIPTITTLTIGPVSSIDDRGMSHVAEMTQLERLGLNGLPITDAGLQELHTLKNLKLLTAYATNCTQPGIDAFQKAVPDCEIRWGPRD